MKRHLRLIQSTSFRVLAIGFVPALLTITACSTPDMFARTDPRTALWQVSTPLDVGEINIRKRDGIVQVVGTKYPSQSSLDGDTLILNYKTANIIVSTSSIVPITDLSMSLRLVKTGERTYKYEGTFTATLPNNEATSSTTYMLPMDY